MSKKLTLQQMKKILACVDAPRRHGVLTYTRELERQLHSVGLGRLNWDSVPELRTWLDIGYALTLPELGAVPDLSTLSDRVREKYDVLMTLHESNVLIVGDLHRMLMQEMIDERLGIPCSTPAVPAELDVEMGS